MNTITVSHLASTLNGNVNPRELEGVTHVSLHMGNSLNMYASDNDDFLFWQNARWLAERAESIRSTYGIDVQFSVEDVSGGYERWKADCGIY